MDEILRLKDLSFRYEEEKEWALKEVSLSISSGEKIAVLGNNGAGKSTFFRCCNGILRPKEGSLYLKGEKISWKKKEILNLRQSVGLIFQEADHQLIAGTVAEEVSFGPMNLKLSEQEVRNRVEKALAAMDLLKYQEKAPHELSGGEKKRVSIADILAMEPELMLLDEPASSLDPAESKPLRGELGKASPEGNRSGGGHPRCGFCLAVGKTDPDLPSGQACGRRQRRGNLCRRSADRKKRP